MKHILILLCILVVGVLAYVDAKDRIEELDEVAANTPSQVEMKQNIDPPKPTMSPTQMQTIQPKPMTDIQKAADKVNKDKQYLDKKFDSFQEKRNTITNPIQ